MTQPDLTKAALRGEPSYVWREGQVRRLKMILDAAGDRIQGNVLENGCGVGMYVQNLSPSAGLIVGLEFDFDRSQEAHKESPHIINSAGEKQPFSAESFDIILSHEVLEHVRDDRQAVIEMVRTLKFGGRIIVFCPNRGYPFETHGIFWRRQYRFGNIPFVNWLPRKWRDVLAPHVRVYTRRDIKDLFYELPVDVLTHRIIYGGYDNLIIRFGFLGKTIRRMLQFLERTPLQIFGLSHFVVVEKTDSRD